MKQNLVQQPKKSSNVLYIDFLRIFTTFTVIILHTSAVNWNNVLPNTFSWQIFNLYDTFVHCNVPVFFMISGSLFLNTSYKLSYKKLYTKNILRLVVAYFFWSFVYAIITYINGQETLNLQQSIIFIIKATYQSHYHLWFLPILIGLYAMLPMLKPVTEHQDAKKICLYWLLIFFLLRVVTDSIFVFNVPYKERLSGLINRFYLSPILGWIGYFIMGHYIRNYDLSKRTRIIIYICGFIGFLISLIGNSYISCKTKVAGQFYYGSFSITSFTGAAAWFTFFKYQVSKIGVSERGLKVLRSLSKNSFGIYLVHAAVLRMICGFGLTPLSLNAIISVPLIALIVFLISYIISAIINKIPFINKYIA